MKKVFENIMTAILAIIIFVMSIVVTFNITVGMLEIAWWIITGEFFHFVDLSVASSIF